MGRDLNSSLLKAKKKPKDINLCIIVTVSLFIYNDDIDAFRFAVIHLFFHSLDNYHHHQQQQPEQQPEQQ